MTKAWPNLLYGAAATAGCLMGVLTSGACRPEPGVDPCGLAEIQGIEPAQGYYAVDDRDLPDHSLNRAPVYVEGDRVSLSWFESEVEHRIVWQIESYEWTEY